MPLPPESDATTDTRGVAIYMAAMSASMAKMARANGLDALAYLFELARLEAESVQQYSGTGSDAEDSD